VTDTMFSFILSIVKQTAGWSSTSPVLADRIGRCGRRSFAI